MEIKKREVLFGVIIVLVMLMLGLLIGGKISEGAIQEAERYATATVIEDERQFRYGMDTNFGNALVYGDLMTNTPVTYDEIGNGYIYIEKVKEHYTRHTRTVTTTDSNGKTHTKTEVYYTWDRVWSDRLRTDSITFCGYDFASDIFSLPVHRLNLSEAGVKNRMNYIYHGSDDRYYYNVTYNNISGTVLANLKDGTMVCESGLYEDEKPAKVIESKQGQEVPMLIIFWVFWILLTGGCVVGFVYLDNRWLD